MIYTRVREKYWRTQKILEPDGSGPLKWATYQAVMKFQDNRCAVCDKLFFVNDKGSDTADHDHVTGLFRGVLCGKRRGCNWRFVGKVERFPKLKIVKGSGEEAAKAYVANPPAKRWLEAGKP
jgi:hypothetical protein